MICICFAVQKNPKADRLHQVILAGDEEEVMKLINKGNGQYAYFIQNHSGTKKTANRAHKTTDLLEGRATVSTRAVEKIQGGRGVALKLNLFIFPKIILINNLLSLFATS